MYERGREFICTYYIQSCFLTVDSVLIHHDLFAPGS